MQTASRVSLRESSPETWAFVGYLIYAISTLGSQATMSIGIAFALLGQWILFRGPLRYLKELRKLSQIPAVRTYLFWSNFLNIACLISLLAARFFPVSLGGVFPEVHFLKDMWKGWYLYWPLLLLPGFLHFSAERAQKLLNVYLGFAVFICALGWIQFFTGFPTKREIPELGGYFHVQGIFGHHLSFASIMIFPFFMLLDETFRQWQKKGSMLRLTGTVVMLVALLGTFSRMLWIGLPLGLGLYIFIHLKGKNRWLALGSGLVALAIFTQIPTVKSRILNSMGTSERYAIWKINGEFFKMRPITGVGWHHNLPLTVGYFKEHYPDAKNVFVGHAHNNLVEVAASLGLIGLIAFIGWNLFVLRMGALASPGLFAAWVVFHLNGLTQVNFWEAKVLHTMGFTLAFLFSRKVRRAETT